MAAPRSGSGESYDVPILIQNFNQVSYLRLQIDWLLRAGYRNITVIDNASDYRPLLAYYDEMVGCGAIKIFRRATKDGKFAPWTENIVGQLGIEGPFVYTCSDIVPDVCCPPNIVEHLAQILAEDSTIVKAGLGLRIDDLPDCYGFRDKVVAWESQYWRAPVANGLFAAPIDTTFALYRPAREFASGPAIRTGWPYIARHEPWYADTANRTAEELNYAATIAAGRGHWGRDRLPEWLDRACAELAASSPPTLLNLQCGHAAIPGWINLDADASARPDIVFDIGLCQTRPLPFDDDSVDAAFMGQGFETAEAVFPMMQELYRVAKDGGRFILRLKPEGLAESEGGMLGPCLAMRFNCFAQPAQPQTSRYAGDWRPVRIKRVIGEHERLRELIVEFRAVKPARQRDPALLGTPEITTSPSAIDWETSL